VWEGPEIEGHVDLGDKTLFVRYDFFPRDRVEDMELLTKYKRIWFCSEYIDFETINYCADRLGMNVCYEINPLYKRSIISENVRCYLKISFDLKDGDHICVGPAYNDESFMIGEGKKVNVDEYAVDVRIR